MYVLEKLWRGEISPMERPLRRGSEYHQKIVEICGKMDALLEALPPAAKAQVEELDDLKTDLSLLAEKDSFLYGFRMGARTMLDILGEYEGQFRDLPER